MSQKWAAQRVKRSRLAEIHRFLEKLWKTILTKDSRRVLADFLYVPIMGAPYNPVTVANSFIEKASEQGRQLTPMQIIKLVYIAHGFSLAMLKRPLLKEGVEAWRYGPVIPSLYRRLKKYGSAGVGERLPPAFSGLGTEQLEPVDQQLVDAVFDKYGSLTAAQLSHLTHRRGTPWADSYSPDELGTDIDDALIGEHYATLLANSAAAN